MNMTVLPFMLVAVLLNTGAQLLLKAGVMRIGQFGQVHFAKLFHLGIQVVSNPYIFFGLFSYVFSLGLWLVVLSKVEVSLAYPMASLGYILNAITAYYLFGESLSIERMAGIMIILLGVFLVARS